MAGDDDAQKALAGCRALSTSRQAGGKRPAPRTGSESTTTSTARRG